MSDPSVNELVQQIVAANEALARNEPGARERLLNQSYALTAALEIPSESIQRMGWAEPARLAHSKMAVDLKLFDTLKASGRAMSAAELAKASGADATLLSRMMRHLAATHVVREAEPGRFGLTEFSLALTEARFRDGITYVHEVAGPSFHDMPAYFASIGYSHPTELAAGPFQHAHDTKLPFFAYLAEQPQLLSVFSSYMAAYRAGHPAWWDEGFYPVQQELAARFDAAVGPVLLVDVGGGRGHDLADLAAKHPSLPGRLVLQDQPDVVATLTASEMPFEATAHDFFQPQLVQHAAAYHLHSVLHDWGDDDCVRILNAIRPAMKAGYSALLLYEIAVPERGAQWPVTSMDWLMMALGAMRERTLAEWEQLLHRAGLRLSKVWTHEGVAESLMVAELA